MEIVWQWLDGPAGMWVLLGVSVLTFVLSAILKGRHLT